MIFWLRRNCPGFENGGIHHAVLTYAYHQWCQINISQRTKIKWQSCLQMKKLPLLWVSKKNRKISPLLGNRNDWNFAHIMWLFQKIQWNMPSTTPVVHNWKVQVKNTNIGKSEFLIYVWPNQIYVRHLFIIYPTLEYSRPPDDFGECPSLWIWDLSDCGKLV
jgi:hypothetical protein